MSEKFDLSIDSPVFVKMRSAFNVMLQNTFKAMQKKNVNEADINITLNINLKDFYISSIDRNVRAPIFEHKITSKMQVKDSVKGVESGIFEIKFNNDEQQYFLQECNEEQISMFEDEGESDVE